MHAISSYRGNRPPTHTNPQTGPITIHCAAASLARSITINLTNLNKRQSPYENYNRVRIRQIQISLSAKQPGRWADESELFTGMS